MDGLTSPYIQSFPAAFMSFSYDRALNPFQHLSPPTHNFITGIKIVAVPESTSENPLSECYRLDGGSVMVVERNPFGLPVTDIGIFEDVPAGWNKIEVSPGSLHGFSMSLAYLKLNKP